MVYNYLSLNYSGGIWKIHMEIILKSCRKRVWRKEHAHNFYIYIKIDWGCFCVRLVLEETFARALTVSLLAAWPFAWPWSLDSFTSWICLRRSGRYSGSKHSRRREQSCCNAFKSSLKSARQLMLSSSSRFLLQCAPSPGPLVWCMWENNPHAWLI